LAVLATSVAALVAVSAISRTLQTRVETQVLNTSAVVGQSDFALNAAILRSAKAITGADIITYTTDGNIVATTVSSSYPEELLRDIADEVLLLFQEARAAHLPMLELNIHFASLLITAREMRGGAIIFLSPKTKSYTSSN